MASKQLINRQDENYKCGYEFSRSTMLDLTENENFLKQFEPIFDLQNYFSRKIWRDLRSRKLVCKKNDRSVADHLYLEDVDRIAEKYFFSLSFIKRQIIRPVLQTYTSYYARNKKTPKQMIKFGKNGKGIHLYDGCVKINKKEKTLTIFPYNRIKHKDKEPIILSYKMMGSTAKKEHLISETPGGNISFKKGRMVFTPRVKIPVKYKYLPEGFLGFDLNKTNSTFMYFSKPIMFKGEEIHLLSKKGDLFKRIKNQEQILKETVNLINENKKTKKERVDRRNKGLSLDGFDTVKNRKYWKKLKKTHRILHRLYDDILEEIVNYCEANKQCLCIDAVTTGNKNGSFGQDKVVEKLTTLCENKFVPFVLVPTPYTSKLCNSCWHLNDISLKDRKFTCEKCNLSLIRDLNAARNIEDRGRGIWYLGIKNYKKIFNSMTGKNLNK